MNFYIRKAISVIMVLFFLILFYFPPSRVFSQGESSRILITNEVLADSTDRENLINFEDQEKSDVKQKSEIKESTSVRSLISVNLLLYIIYKLTFKQVD